MGKGYKPNVKQDIPLKLRMWKKKKKKKKRFTCDSYM